MQRPSARRSSARILPFVCSSLLVLIAVKSWACKCDPITVEDDYKTSDIVFYGEVLQKGESATSLPRQLLIEVEFEVEDMWKGEKTSRIEVSTEPYSASCGYKFEVGTSYLVFVDRRESQTNEASDAVEYLYTGWCSANQPRHDSLVSIALTKQLEELRLKDQGETTDESYISETLSDFLWSSEELEASSEENEDDSRSNEESQAHE